MSESDLPSEEEIEEFEQDLKQDTAKARAEQEQQKEALLESVKSDDELGGEDTVQIGGMEVRHKSYIPGKQLRKIQQTKQAMSTGGETPGDEDELELLVDITQTLHDTETGESYTDEELIEMFWNGFIEEYGTDAYSVIMERLLEPILEATEKKMGGLQSFQEE